MVDPDKLREFANSTAWKLVMEPLIDRAIDKQEGSLEASTDPYYSHAIKTAWSALRQLKASVEIYKDK